MPVRYSDYSQDVKAMLHDVAVNWLYETGAAVSSHAARNCKMRRDGESEGQKLARSYKSVVNEGDLEAQVGSHLESVYWEEYGTGEHAAHKDGRKGWWVYVKDGTVHKNGGVTYDTQEEAESIAENMRREGLDAYATNGRDPQYTLEKAFRATEPKAKKRFQELLKGGAG